MPMIGSSVNKFSVVIPLIPQHDREVGRIFSELQSSNNFLEEIIICRSESLFGQNRTKARMKKLATKNGINSDILRFSFVTSKATAGENRNRGWKLASGFYVAFIDADDSYVNNRLELIHGVLMNSVAKAVVHNFGNSSHNETQATKELVESTQVKIDKHGNFIAGKFQVSFQCAHLTLVGSLRDDYQYTDIFPGEDLELVTRMIKDGIDVFHIDNELSNWNRNRSLRYEFRRVRKRILSLNLRR